MTVGINTTCCKLLESVRLHCTPHLLPAHRLQTFEYPKLQKGTETQRPEDQKRMKSCLLFELLRFERTFVAINLLATESSIELSSTLLLLHELQQVTTRHVKFGPIIPFTTAIIEICRSFNSLQEILFALIENFENFYRNQNRSSLTDW